MTTVPTLGTQLAEALLADHPPELLHTVLSMEVEAFREELEAEAQSEREAKQQSITVSVRWKSGVPAACAKRRARTRHTAEL